MSELMFFFATTTWALAALLLDRYGKRREASCERWEAIVVAGCHVLPDGSPTVALKRRTELAVELWKEGIAPRIVLTGGVGKNGPSEAAVAAEVALGLGVPSEALILEERSTSTEENARFARDALGSSGPVIVVSDTYHVLRCERVFNRYFERARGLGSVSRPWPRIKGSLREVGALGFYAVTGRLR